MKRQGKIFLALLPALILLGVGTWGIIDKDARLPFTAEKLNKERQRIQDLQEIIRKALVQQQDLARELREMKEFQTSGIAVEADKVGTVCRERIESAASEAGFKMNSMSDIRRVDITEKISLYELNIGGECQLEELTGLMAGFSRPRPRIYWKSINIKPNNIVKPEKQVLSGVVAMLNFVPEDGEAEQ